MSLFCDVILKLPDLKFQTLFFRYVSQKAKNYAAGEPKSKRFRHNVADLMLSNQISGQRAQELCQDALASGPTGVEDLVKGADAPHALAAGRNRNALRDMKRRLMQRCPWFGEYLAMVPVWNPGKQKEQLKALSFLLPHELIHAFLGEDRELLLQRNIWSTCKGASKLLKLLQWVCGLMGPPKISTGAKLWNAFASASQGLVVPMLPCVCHCVQSQSIGASKAKLCQRCWEPLLGLSFLSERCVAKQKA